MGDQMKVRFLFNKATNRILYMEAGKDLVDMLLAFLQLPMASIFGIFAEQGAGGIPKVGSMSSLYESFQKLSDSSFAVSKGDILNPYCPFKLSRTTPKLLLPADSANISLSPLPTTVYRCNNSSCNTPKYVSWSFSANCPQCGNRDSMKYAVTFTGKSFPDGYSPLKNVATPSKGFVHSYLSFIVTDDLSILPASTIESIVLINRLQVEKISDLDSFSTSVTTKEALGLLRAAFTCDKALNKVFGAKIPAGGNKREAQEI